LPSLSIGFGKRVIYQVRVSNFPLAYKLSWLPRLLNPSLAGDRGGYAPAGGVLLSPPPIGMRRIAFLGDISAVANRTAPVVDEDLRALIASADLVVGNCEAPILDRPRYRLGTAIGTLHAMTPGFLAETLQAAAIEPSKLVLSVANNHMLDQGVEGYAATRRALEEFGIAMIGGIEDGPARLIDLAGVKLAFAAFTQWRNAEADAFAGRVTMLDDIAGRDFAALRHAADLMCVVPHWDREFRHFPLAATRQIARSLVDNGARLIVGHHAHVVQPAERIGESLVAYGIGDFLSTALPRQPWPTRLGTILLIEISADPNSKGEIAGWCFTSFFRHRANGHERLVSLQGKTGDLYNKVNDRFRAIFPPPKGSFPARRSG